MARARRPADPSVPCYAMTVPGLEKVAAEEIESELGAEVKRVTTGLVVFRPPAVTPGLLELRTVEDVFLLLWGTDALTLRAADLDNITRWTSKEPDWPRLLAIHHAVHPKKGGRPTYHLVTQMRGEHVYQRKAALKALAKGLEGKFPHTWRPVNEDAAVEVWLTIHERTAICGLRLSDKTMRHRTYKEDHLPASLRPTVAAAMVRLSRTGPRQVLLDPMCGAGTVLAERLSLDRQAPVLGGDIEAVAVRAAYGNLRHFGRPSLCRWDSRLLPLPDDSVERLACNPPFGKQLSPEEDLEEFYADLMFEWNRVLRRKGRAVLLVSDFEALARAAEGVGWERQQKLRVRILGQPAVLSVWQKA